MPFECGTRILRVIHGRDARATPPNCTSTEMVIVVDKIQEHDVLAERRGE